MFFRTSLVLAAALALPVTAKALDADACRTAITGNWTITSATQGDPAMRISFNADGTYQRGTEVPAVEPVQDDAAMGAWEAKAGGEGTACEIVLTSAAELPEVMNLTEVTQAAFKTAAGETGTRMPDSAPALIN